MAKLKYYQLAYKDGVFKKLVSPSSLIISNMILDGYNFFGYDNEIDIPNNPIVDGVIIREMTTDEIEAKVIADNETKLQNDITNLNSCTKLELYEALESLDTINSVTSFTEMFDTFKLLPKYDLTNDFDFTNPIVVQAMAKIDPVILQSMKEQIIKNRG